MLWRGSGGSGERLLTDVGREVLHLGEDFEGYLWARAVALGLQAHTHDSV